MRGNKKMIVSEVNQLLHRNYSLICFNALNSQELLYVLRDVVAKIQGDREVDSKMSPEQMAVYILSVLRICKYEPQIDPVQFRQGLIRGDSETINPILEWLLTHIDLVKKRCYLSRFLVKVEVPMEYLSNPEISSLYEQYLSLVDRFKVVHKERDVGNKNIYTATELTADLQIMEKEKEAVTARIEKMTVKVKSAMELLDCAHALRMEKDRERDLAVQKEQEREAVTSMQMSLQIIERELQTLERNENEMSVESLIRHLGEEITVQTTIVKEQLPAVMSTRKRQIKALLTVNETAYLTPEYITALKSTFDTTVKGIQNLLELKISKIDTDRMEPFRQQVAAVGNMKRNVLAKLEICDNTLLDIRRKFEEQREQSKILTEEIVPKGEELKKYIMRLKNRSTLYKHYKSELAALTAENSVLYRTAAILENQLKQSDGNGKLLQQVEENLSDDLTRENVFSINQQLSQSMSAFYAKLAPLISEVQQLQRRLNEGKKEYKKLSKNYITMGTNMTEQTVNLLSETKKVKDELTKAMEQKKTLNHTIERMRYIETRMKMAQDPERKESILDKTFFKDLNDEITAAEKHVNNLTMEKENLRQNISQYERQMQIWQSIIIILSSKSKSAEENKQSNGILLRKSGAETLILE